MAVKYPTKHGMHKSLTYSVWASMRSRCNNPNNDRYQSYGGRGISICSRWESFDNFLADMGERPSKSYTLGRIDNDAGYSPENCRWETCVEQANNRRNTRYVEAFGQRKPIGIWAREVGLSVNAIASRLHIGWPPDEALSLPITRGPRRTTSGGNA